MLAETPPVSFRQDRSPVTGSFLATTIVFPMYSWRMLLKGIIGLLAVMVWFAVFLAGLTIDSKPYRMALSGGNIEASDLAMTMLTFTVTNSAILCVLSGVVGALSYTVLFTSVSDDRKHEAGAMGNQIQTTVEAVLGGVLRGFVIFLVFISGVYLGASDAFGSTTQEQYARVVATTCLLSFLVSFRPEYFSKVTSMLARPERLGD